MLSAYLTAGRVMGVFQSEAYPPERLIRMMMVV